jgi:hypothetical protein
MSRLLPAAGLVALIALHGCSREAPRRPPASHQPPPATHPDDSLPSRAAYAGSETCRECHQKNFDRWSHDWHAHALSKPTPEGVAGDFRHAHFKGSSNEAWFTRAGDKYVVRTRNREGELADYPVSWLIGAKRMQDPVTIFPDGRWQVLPVYTHVTGGASWVDYNEAKQGVVTSDHPYFWTNFKRTANKECLECHATGVDVRYDRATHEWSTSFADAGVACEDCHGPGARHAETKAKSDIVRADHLDKERELSICARCHGPREPLFPLLDARDQFRPGERYADRYKPLVITDGTERSGEFFADGRPSSSSFEYQALIQSRCYLRGHATCLTCHTAPHEDHVANDVKPGDVCAGCHKIDRASHSHHKTATCVDCHMPHVATGVLDTFPDHTLDIPNPRNTIAHGAPNACGVCHRDRSPSALQASIDTWWPAARARQQRRVLLADAIDEKTREGSRAPLEQVIRDAAEAPSLRGACAILLAQRFPSEAGGVIAPLLPTPDPLLRANYLEALGYAAARTTADDVARLLNDPSIRVRQMSALVLSSFHDPRAEPALTKLADDPSTRNLVRPHITLAIAAANRGDMPRAQQELEFVVSEVPYATDATVMLADIAIRRGDRPTAKAWLEEALRFNPSHRGARGRLEALEKR